MLAIHNLLSELAITIRDPAVWSGIALAIVLGAVCLALGIAVGRLVGVLGPGLPAGETLGVGLSLGLMVTAAWWAAIWSGGRSAFTPVAIGFAISLAFALITRARRPGATRVASSDEVHASVTAAARGGGIGRRLSVGLAAASFVAVIAMLYGSTLAPSPRDGVQPVEFNDVAFYAVLGRDLATTGTETTLSATGFDALPDLPAQAWYHWGELWLASAVIKVFGVSAMAARYLIVLPLLLLAASSLTGSIVQRMTGSTSTTAFLLGFFACLLLAPVALIPGPFFASWASGMIFGITLYGTAVTAVLFLLYCIASLPARGTGWALVLFVGCAIAFVLPAHVAVALLGLVGLGTAATVRVGRWAVEGRSGPPISPTWVRIWSAAGAAGIASLAWGFATGHELGGGSGPALVTPFNGSWQASVAVVTLGAGIFFAIAFAIPLAWRRKRDQAEMYLGTMSLLVVGAIGWGARLGDFTMFYLFFAGIAVIATPVAAIAVRTVWSHLDESGRRRLALAVATLCILQLEAGIPNAIGRLQHFGAYLYEPIPTSLLTAIRSLPTDAKLAYACEPLEESSFGVPQLGSIDAHTGRRVVPLCFNAEVLSSLNGAPRSPEVPNLYFASAPQRSIYAKAAAEPSSDAIAAFLTSHGIDYILGDGRHPLLIDETTLIASSGGTRLYRAR